MRQQILELQKQHSKQAVVDVAERIVYNLTVNLDTSDKQINGASCVVMKIGLQLGQTQPRGVVWVKILVTMFGEN